MAGFIQRKQVNSFMTKRRMKKMMKRAIHLPRGIDLLRYVANKSYSWYLQKNKSLKVAHPSTIMLEVTNLCNLKCITCPREYLFGEQMNKGFMSFEKLKEVVDEAYPYIDSIGLTGLGETFLYKDIVNAVTYIKSKSKGIIVSCSINAHLKTSVEIASRLVNVIDTIQISMDGIGEVYEKVRLKGDFSFFESHLKEIAQLTKNSDTDIMINVVLVKENYHQMAEMIEFVHGLGIHYINMIPMNLVSKTDEDISYYQFFSSPEFLRALESATQTAKKYEDLEFVYSSIGNGGGFGECIYPWNYFYISWDGLLPPCCAKPFPKESTLGNVFQDGLMNGLNSKEFQEFRRLSHNNETPDFCKKCSVIN
jgi:radical SAM protein with 4Fe4S-binding SPASM domain